MNYSPFTTEDFEKMFGRTVYVKKDDLIEMNRILEDSNENI